uniref:Uncharacterized protein n=1 Tax=Anopheles culicifacies TaxID=139723 RepID=A0A182MLJ4_9DIPT
MKYREREEDDPPEVLVVVVVVISSLPLLLLCCTKSISEVRSNVAAAVVEVLLLTEAFAPAVVMATTVAPPPRVIVSPASAPLVEPTVAVALLTVRLHDEALIRRISVGRFVRDDPIAQRRFVVVRRTDLSHLLIVLRDVQYGLATLTPVPRTLPRRNTVADFLLRPEPVPIVDEKRLVAILRDELVMVALERRDVG